MLGYGNRTVRPRSTGRMLAPFCLVVFCLTAIVVYCWGEEIRNHSSAKAKPAATAYIVGRAAKAGQSEVRIPIAAIDDDPRRAEAAANARAENYVKDRRADWQHRTAGAYDKAHQAAEQARHEYAQSEDRLEAFRRQTARATAKPQPTGPRQGDSPSQPMIDNPKWLNLNRRLGELQQRRDALLVDRTPAHPAVEDVAVRIEDLQRQIAAIPRQIISTAPAKQETSAKALAKNGPAAANSVASQNTDKLNELAAAVETTQLACQQAEAAEKQARDAQKAGPQFSVVYAQIAETPPRLDSGWQRLMYTTLGTGLLMAFGAGLLSAGAQIHPTVASAAEVQAVTGVPIMATIPPTSPRPNPLWLSCRQRRVRRTLLAVGLLLVAACPAAAVWGLM